MIEKAKARVEDFFSNSILISLLNKIRSNPEKIQVRQVKRNLPQDEKLKYLYKAIKEGKISYQDAQKILRKKPLTSVEIQKFINEISFMSHVIWSDIPSVGFNFTLHRGSQPLLSSNPLLENKEIKLNENASIFLPLQILFQFGVFRILKDNKYLSGAEMLEYGQSDSFEHTINGYGLYVLKFYLGFIHDEDLDKLWCYFQEAHPIPAEWQSALEVFLRMQKYPGGAEILMKTNFGDIQLANQFARVRD